MSAAGDRTTVGPAAPWGGRFAPRSSLSLISSFRGAKSSHSRHRFSPFRPPGGFRFLLPSPREPLGLRPGEQNLHIPDAGFHPSGRPATSALCSPLPAKPCASVPGSKIFTQLPAPKRRSAGNSAASALCSPLPARPCGSVPGSKIFTQLPAPKRSSAGKSAGLFAPLSPRTLGAPSWGAKSSHNFRPLSAVSPENRLPAAKKTEAAAPFGAAASFALSRLPYLPVFTVFSSSGFRPVLRGLQRMRPSDPDTGLRCCHLR